MKKTRNFSSLPCKARLARSALALLGVVAGLALGRVVFS